MPQRGVEGRYALSLVSTPSVPRARRCAKQSPLRRGEPHTSLRGVHTERSERVRNDITYHLTTTATCKLHIRYNTVSLTRRHVVQTCSLCNAESPDQARMCQNCHADLREHSTTAYALKRFRANPRVAAIKVMANDAACSYCYEQSGTYSKDKVPHLPHSGCSHTNGCRCFYVPVLTDIYP